MFIDFVLNIWHVTQELALWLLLGCAIAGILHVFLPPDYVRRHLGRGSWGNVVKATLLGVPLPLCSCGVVPAAIGLRKDGASDASAVGFLVSTPQTGVDSIVVSAAFLGWPFALFKVASAFVTGVIAGGVVHLTEGQPKDELTPPVSSQQAAGCLPSKIREAARFAVSDLLAGFIFWVILGILVSALITTLMPPGALSDTVLSNSVAGVLLMLFVSLPLYVCATGSVPVAAALVGAGMPTGAALVFLMAGPATNAATLGAVFKQFGTRVTSIYVAVIAIGSVGLGLLYEVISLPLYSSVSAGHGSHSLLHQSAAVVLLVLATWILYQRLKSRWTQTKVGTSCCSSTAACPDCH